MIVRTLIDGYNLLHSWKHLAAGSARHSQTAREELVKVLRRYADTSSVPITVVFDGQAESLQPERTVDSEENLEILYTPSRQSADQVIERAAILYLRYGEVMVVTNDTSIRELVIGNGGVVSSCDNFLLTLQDTCHEMGLKLKYYNWDTNNRFKRQRHPPRGS
ncbi:MAG: NYN domain-containing protein [Limisphaerales bacterium]|jgi:predicted RNA-binding protein with PIN domain|nr:NYN domain-containing protein [Verrucomicrobiota bacterium]